MGRPSIYALCDPDTGALRYIGKANDPEARFKSHVRDSRRRDTPVYRWIRKLARSGVSPEMVVVASDCSDWKGDERRLIAAARSAGHRLLNVAAGGDQPDCPDEVRSANGRALNERLTADPLLRRVRDLNRALSTAHRLRGLSERVKSKLRVAAQKRPDLFGRWATV